MTLVRGDCPHSAPQFLWGKCLPSGRARPLLAALGRRVRSGFGGTGRDLPGTWLPGRNPQGREGGRRARGTLKAGPVPGPAPPCQETPSPPLWPGLRYLLPPLGFCLAHFTS